MSFPIFYEVLPLAPVPKGRPRVTRRGHCYTPKRTSDFELQVKSILRTKWRGPPLSGPLRVSLAMYLPRATSNKTSYPLSPRSGDVDNLAKCVMDAANRILWEDDSQVVELHASKLWATEDACIIMTIRVAP